MMSVKKMISLYVEYGLSEETWDMLRNMSLHNLISRENWMKFFETCKDWYLEDNGVIDGNGTLVYKYDENGTLRKVA